jgi:hypothetical protein
MIPATEFGRRLCVAHHPHLATTGAAVPCGEHTTVARNLYPLLSAQGTVSLIEVLNAREEAGIGMTRKKPRKRKVA